MATWGDDQANFGGDTLQRPTGKGPILNHEYSFFQQSTINLRLIPAQIDSRKFPRFHHHHLQVWREPC